MTRIAVLFVFCLLFALSCKATEDQVCQTVSPTSVTVPAQGGYSSDITVVTAATWPVTANCGIYAPINSQLSSSPGRCINSCNNASLSAISVTGGGLIPNWTFVDRVYAPPNLSCLTNTYVFGNNSGQSVTAVQPSACGMPLPPANPTAGLGPAGSPSNPQAPAAEPVSTGNGNYYYVHTDLSVFNHISTLPVNFQRSYNSLDNVVGPPMGNAWTHNYNITIGQTSGGAIGVRWGDGHWETYNFTGTSYTPGPGVTNTLTKDPATGNYTIETKSGLEYFFASNGLLSSIQDPNGRTITAARDVNSNLISLTSGQQTISFTYDASNRLSSMADASGRTVSYTYDTYNNLISETDPAGNITQYTYGSPTTQLTSIILPNGSTLLQNTYDSSGRVISQANANGFTTTFSYSTPSAGKTTISDPLGDKTVHTYDQSLRITSISNALAEATNFTYGNNSVTYSYTGMAYNQFGGTFACPPVCGIKGSFTVAAPLPPNQNFYFTPISFSFTDGLTVFTAANVTTSAFGVVTDSAGNIVGWNMEWLTPNGEMFSGTNPPGCVGCSVIDGSFNPSAFAEILGSPGTWTISLTNSNNNVTAITNGKGQTSNFSYDSLGNLLGSADPLGNTTKFTYNSFSEPLTITTPRGNTTSFLYDSKGNLISVQDPQGNKSVLGYDASGDLLSVTDARGNSTSLSYSGCNFCVTAITDPIGNKTNFAYDTIGRPVSFTDANNHTTAITYDALGRILSETDALGNQTLFAYDLIGHLTSITDANKHATSYSYDPVGNLTLVTDALGHKTSYSYDGNNNLTSITNGNNHVINYTYDAANRLLMTTSPLAETTSYSYDANGNIVALKDANGKTNAFAYDSDNRLTGINYSDGTSVAYTFDGDGDRLSMADSHGTTSYTYDALNRVLSTVFPGGKALQYGYDVAGNRASLQYPDGKLIAYAFDQDNRLSQVTDWLQRNTTYAYDPGGNVRKIAYPTGVAEQFAYDAANRLTQIMDQNGNGTFRALAYTLDASGNRTNVTDNGLVTTYTYDALNELTSSTSAGAATSWQYDAVGNRTSQMDPSATTLYTYDAADQMLTAGPATFTYDKNGNRMTRVGLSAPTTYSYDAANRLLSVASAKGTSSFTYDGDGNRVTQTTSTGAYSYVNDTSVALAVVLNENGTDGVIDYSYGLGLMESSSSAFNYFYGFDGLGSVSDLTDAYGKVRESYLFDSWGNSLTGKGSVGTKNKFRFTGQALDPATGLYFMGARYYDPTTGRFLSRDPFPGFATYPATLHRYMYAGNNPIRFVDPSGKFIQVPIAIGLAIANYCGLAPEICAAPIVWLLEKATNSTTGLPPTNPVDWTLWSFDQGEEAINRSVPPCAPPRPPVPLPPVQSLSAPPSVPTPAPLPAPQSSCQGEGAAPKK